MVEIKCMEEIWNAKQYICTGVEISLNNMTFFTWKDRFSSDDKIGHFETYKIKMREEKWRDQIGHNPKLNKITNCVNYYELWKY
jgi:hypothetical protein